jgi:hypothetical protein
MRDTRYGIDPNPPHLSRFPLLPEEGWRMAPGWWEVTQYQSRRISHGSETRYRQRKQRQLQRCSARR